MSNTYTREKQKRALRHLRDSSASVMDFRSRTIYIELARKHPKMPPSLIYNIAETRAMFITLFQAPLESIKRRQMKRMLKRRAKIDGLKH